MTASLFERDEVVHPEQVKLDAIPKEHIEGTLKQNNIKKINIDAMEVRREENKNNTNSLA